MSPICPSDLQKDEFKISRIIRETWLNDKGLIRNSGVDYSIMVNNLNCRSYIRNYLL